jgi:CubicO group peptidase (beta-lactamase class C family)
MRTSFLKDLTGLVDSAILEQVFPGCSIGIVTRSGGGNVFSFGNYTYETNALKVMPDTLYDVASVTKVVPTTLLAYLFLQERKIRLTTKLIEYVPDYVGAYREEITLFHLLTQSLSFPFSLSSYTDEVPDMLLYRIFHASLSCPPGLYFQYTNTTSILLSIFLERVAGMAFDELARKMVFEPLLMTYSTFLPGQKESCVPTEIVQDTTIQGIVHDESARILFPIMYVGSAGLFSSAGDLLRVSRMLLSGGMLEEQKFFTSESVKQMQRPVTLGDGASVGLGFEMNALWMGENHSKKTLGKTGFTGCFILTDFEKGIGIVHLSNRTYPHRPESGEKINAFRKALINLILQADVMSLV